MVIRSEVFSKYGLSYDADYPHAEDYKLWLEILKIGKLANIPLPVVYYRVHHNQVSSKFNVIQAQTGEKIRLEATNFSFRKTWH